MPTESDSAGASSEVISDIDFGRTIAEWLERRGCPHFVRDSHPWKQAPELLLMLILVSALEVGVWPYLDLPTFWLLVAPVPFILLARLLRKKFVKVVGPHAVTKKLRGGLVVLIIFPAFALLVIGWSSREISDRVPGQGLLQILAPEPWVKFGTLLGTFVAALLLFNRVVWRRSTVLKRFAVWVGVVATLIWVSGDGIVLYGSSRLITLIGSLSALVALVLIMFVALGMGSAESDGRKERRWAPFAAVTVLVIGIDASLPSDVEAGVDEIAGVSVIIVVLGLFWLLVYALTSRRNWSDVQLVEGTQALHPRSIAVWIAAFLFACPVWLILAAWARSGGAWEWSTIWMAVSGQHDAIWVLLINIAWLFVIWAITIYRLPQIMKWAAKMTWKRLPLLLRDLMVGLPALILFTAFLMLTSDTWQVLSKIGAVQFWMAVGGLMVVSIAFLVTAAWLKVAALDGFRNKAALLRALNSTEVDSEKMFEEALASIEKDAGHAALAQPRVNKGARVNGVLILVFFQVVVLTIVGVVAALVFWFVAGQVVSEEVAADWISSYRSLEITPSTSARVVILMTAFATLYMSANIAVAGRPTNDDPESEAASFQDVADEDLAERLALRRVHYALSDPVVQRPARRSAQPVPDVPLPQILLGGLLLVLIACSRVLVRLLRLRVAQPSHHRLRGTSTPCSANRAPVDAL